MDRLQRNLERFLPHSAFGLTLVTIAIMLMILGFFVRDLHFPGEGDLPGDDQWAKNVPSSSDPPDGSIPDDRYSPDPTDEGNASLLTKDEASLKEGFSADEGSAAEVEPSSLYAENVPGEPPKIAPGYVAQLTRTSDCRWAEDAESPAEGTQFKSGQTLNVAAGMVEISFACGAKAVLEGPAVLELQSEKSGSLKFGKLHADVPDEVKGFTVSTPMVQVVSLCTTDSNGVAKLTGTTDCHWAKGNATSKKGGSLLPGQAVKLLDGLAEITFASGAKVVLQGPAHLEIESEKTAILHSGRLTANVPDDLEGFKIRTPSVEILSLPPEAKGPTSESTRQSSAPRAARAEPPKSDRHPTAHRPAAAGATCRQ
jgi:hypothetical protein